MTAERKPQLFIWPKQATFNRIISKNKIYAHANPGSRLKQRFTDEIAQIKWLYKLAPDTVRIPERPGVPEIQIFGLTLKDDGAQTFSLDVLHCIDKAIGFPIIFEVAAGDRVKAVAAHKRPSDADAAKWVLGSYHATAWLPVDARRSPLPVAVDLGVLYTKLLGRLMPHPPREGETLRAHAERLDQVEALQREREKLEKKMAREKHFNRKVEMNGELRRLNEEIEQQLRIDS